MELIGKAKKDFEKWYSNEKPNGHWYCMVNFYGLTLSMQYGVYVDWFNSVRIYPNISNEAYKNGVNTLWQVFEYDNSNLDNWSNNSSGLYGDNGNYDLNEARTEAIKKANGIYNNK